MLKRLSLAILFSVPVMAAGVGCSSADAPASSSEQSGDDIVASKSRRVQDLFHPDESTLGSIVTSTMAGIDHWEVYGSDAGLTVKGISQSKKIKVVYAVPISTKDGQVAVDGAGFVRASDFDLPADNREALVVLTRALQTDL